MHESFEVGKVKACTITTGCELPCRAALQALVFKKLDFQSLLGSNGSLCFGSSPFHWKGCNSFQGKALPSLQKPTYETHHFALTESWKEEMCVGLVRVGQIPSVLKTLLDEHRPAVICTVLPKDSQHVIHGHGGSHQHLS